MARSSEFNFERKAEARSAITGHLGTTVGSIIFYLVTALILSTISVNIFPGSDVASTIGFMAVNFLVSLFLGLLMYGINTLHLSLVYGQDVSFGGLFEGFRRGVNDRIIKVQAVLTAVNFVCTLPATLYASKLTGLEGIRTHLLPLAGLYLLGSIAEIWFALGFAMCYFLIADFPEMSSAQVLRTSVRMMKGPESLRFGSSPMRRLPPPPSINGWQEISPFLNDVLFCSKIPVKKVNSGKPFVSIQHPGKIPRK